MDDTSEEEKQRILKTQPSLARLSSHLILIPENHKLQAAQKKLKEFQEFHAGFLEGARTSQKMDISISSFKIKLMGPNEPMEAITSGTVESSRQGHTTNFPSNRKTYSLLASVYQISIFSRSAETNYTWLVESLRKDDRIRKANIEAVLITNQHSSFKTELKKCNFAILYHTKNHGRINITDVMDSLYDSELQEMSKYLGKENVIVVIDDLGGSIHEERDRILGLQPSICKFALDLFLFSESEKHTKNLEAIKEIIGKRLPRIKGQNKNPDKGPRPSKQCEPQCEDQASAGGSLSSSPESHGYLSDSPRSDSAEAQSKISKTKTSSETTNSMDGQVDPSDVPALLNAVHKKWNQLQKENQELKEKLLCQEEIMEHQLDKIMSLTSQNDRMKMEIEKRDNITRENMEIMEKERQMERAEKEMSEREKNLEERKDMMMRTERHMERAEKEMSEREKNLEERKDMMMRTERHMERAEKEMSEREKKLQERGDMMMRRQRDMEGPEKEMREKILQEEEGVNMKTIFQGGEEGSHGHHQHLKETAQRTEGSNHREDENTKEMISKLQETIKEKDNMINQLNNDILSYTLILNECKCQNE
ncbi:uncharacterized protein [Pyxicephalus adspersus]|uniref:uncharacterized protein n=1 Tax=Pyxicephalus adspersus TaxID=30357 RepID=UPI003B5B40F3